MVYKCEDQASGSKKTQKNKSIPHIYDSLVQYGSTRKEHPGDREGEEAESCTLV
jgi:hypothetical protein